MLLVSEFQLGHSPEEDSPDEEVPEEIDTLEKEDGREDLPLHPPDHPLVVPWVKYLTRRFGDHFKLVVDGPQNPEVEIVTEIGPHPDEDGEEGV